jgi:hypothetical protein
MKRLLATSVAAVLVGTASVALAAVDPETVASGPTDQFLPMAELDDWVGWSEQRAGETRWDAHVEWPDHSHDRRLHRRSGSNSFTGGIARGKVLFQDAKGPSSDLFLYALATGDYSAPPSGINTDLWEWGPDISNRFILFGRNRFTRNISPWKVILYDRQSKTFRTLDQTTNACRCIFPQFVNDRFAVWTKCPNVCNVYVFDTDTGIKRKVPNPGPRNQYNGSVTEDGHVYFLRAGRTCGLNARVMRWTIDGGASEEIYGFPEGYDGGLRTYVVEKEDGHDDLYFDRVNCDDPRFRANVYVIRDADLATPIVTLAAPSSPGTKRALPTPLGATPQG